MRDSYAVNDLRAIAPHAFETDGSVRPFADQVVSYEMGELPSNELLVISPVARAAGLPQIENLPITIDQSTLEKVKVQHGLRPADIKNLGNWIAFHPFAMTSMSMEDALVVVADAIDRIGNHIIIPIHVAKSVNVIGHELIVDDVASIYGKRNLEYMIRNTAALGLRLWVNEKTKDWTSRTGLQLPPLASSLYVNEYTLSRIMTPAALERVTKPPCFDSLIDAGWSPETMFPHTASVEVTPRMLTALVTSWCELHDPTSHPEQAFLECCCARYWCREDDGGFSAVDNTSDGCITEGFGSKLDALDWLLTTGCPGDEFRPLSDLSQEELEEAWASLSDVAIDDSDRIDSDWRGYEAGTDRFDIMRDFDEAYEGGVHSLMFPSEMPEATNPALVVTRASPAGDGVHTRHERDRDHELGR